LQYLLETIHHYVYNKLQLPQLFNLGNRENTDLCNGISEALNALPANMLQQVCSANNNKEKRVLIQSTQSSAIIIANQLHKYAQTVASWPLEETAKQQHLALYNTVRDQLMASLQVLQQFPQYLHSEQQLPVHLYEEQKKAISKEIRLLTDEWKSRIHKILLDIILIPAREFIEPDISQIPTYRQLQYLGTLFKKLKNLSLTCPENAEKAVIDTLITLNFNHDNFIVYAVNKLEPPFSEEGSDGHLLQYRLLLHSLKRLHPVAGVALYPLQPSCSGSIAECIQQEIYLLQKHGTESSITQVVNGNTEDGKLKLHSCLTISQLAFFLHLLHETGILTFKPLEKFFTIVASNLPTQRASRYAPGSLQTGYYTHDLATKQVVKDHLFNLINEVKRA